jgi:uncharacterized heparinase superfamily protein
LSRSLARTRRDSGSPAPIRAIDFPWVAAIHRAKQLLSPNRIELIGRSADISANTIWRDTTLPKLWLYQLHYFDDLNAAQAISRQNWHRALMDRWISENPPGSAIAWDPYPISLRVVNWIKWQLSGTGRLNESELACLAQQVRYLLPRLEYHLLGNHLLENFKTLLIAGCFFDCAEADAWREKGLRGFREQLADQVLADGAHNELAPMYQGIIAEGLLDAMNVMQCLGLEVPDWLAGTARRMVGWSLAISHPDGDWPQFNDTALGAAARPVELAHYLERLGLAPLTPAGRDEVIARRSWGDWVLLADLGGLGPDHNPGHGHADSLTYELSIGGKRVVVDTGISTYEANDTRARERSTAAHNTVQIDGVDSSEVWQSFRVGRRAYTRRVPQQITRGDAIAAEHDGYRNLRGSPIHHREWSWSDARLDVVDRIRSRANHRIRCYIHLHPNYNAAPAADGSCTVEEGSKTIARIVTENWMHLNVSDYHYAPAFGRQIPARCIELIGQSVAGDSRHLFSIVGA